MNNYTLKRVHTSPAIFQQFDSEGNTMGFRSDDERVVEILKNSPKMRLEELVKGIRETAKLYKLKPMQCKENLGKSMQRTPTYKGAYVTKK